MDGGYLVVGILIVCGPIWLLAYYWYLDNKKNVIKHSDEGSISVKDPAKKEKSLTVIKIVLGIFLIALLAIEFDYIEPSGAHFGVVYVALLWALAYNGYQRHKK